MTSQILKQYIKEYKDIFFVEGSNNSQIFSAFNITNKRGCILKVINKEKLKLGNYTFLKKQLKREEEITIVCGSEYTINLYRKIETNDDIIFELEYFENSIYKYICEEGPLSGNLELFKYIVLQIANALKIINQKGIMHRDIKPQNIFFRMENEKMKVKLGDFSCSIFIKDNTSDPIGTFIYSSPEIINEIEYNEKSDLWSLGITLFEIFFGYPPYGPNPTTNEIKNIVLDDNNDFIIKKTNIPTLDILFKRLLVINPDYRMTYDEFFKYVFNNDFMRENIISLNNNQMYKNIYDDILKEPEVIFNLKVPEGLDEKIIQEKCVKKIISFAQEEKLPDIMNFPNENIEEEEVYNNIIYYDENIDHNNSINKDSDYFERNTKGAFILCTDLDSLKLVRAEILKEIENEERIIFNLITTGGACAKIMEFLKEDKKFEDCIKNVCIYCYNLEKYTPLKEIYSKIHDDIYNKRSRVLEFIKKYSDKKIKPFPLVKVVTYRDYIKKYKNRHIKISTFYGDLKHESFEKYFKDMYSLIEKKSKSKELIRNKKEVLDGFLSFDFKKDVRAIDSLIINEYTKNNLYGDFNKLIMNNMEFYETVAYFTARLMYGLNKYAKEKNMYSKERREFYRGLKMRYSSILPYIRAKGKIILLSSFTSTSENITIAEKFAIREKSRKNYKTKLRFSVLFYIKNYYKNNWISSGVNIQYLSSKKVEKEHLFLPFSFYYVRDVQIDIKNCTADIYLETIGKKVILEEEIKKGKQIEYNKNENIIQII